MPHRLTRQPPNYWRATSYHKRLDLSVRKTWMRCAPLHPLRNAPPHKSKCRLPDKPLPSTAITSSTSMTALSFSPPMTVWCRCWVIPRQALSMRRTSPPPSLNGWMAIGRRSPSSSLRLPKRAPTRQCGRISAGNGITSGITSWSRNVPLSNRCCRQRGIRVEDTIQCAPILPACMLLQDVWQQLSRRSSATGNIQAVVWVATAIRITNSVR